MSLSMPHVKPSRETYYCTAFKLDPNDHKYIVGFTPNASKNTAHHILIYGCEEPGFVERDVPRVVWNCGEMMQEANSSLPTGSTCRGKSEIIYAWALDAPKLSLPAGVGFKVGNGTDIHYLVLQVHYGDHNNFPTDHDVSGITLSMRPGDAVEVNKRAGVLLLGTAGMIPPLSVEHMETACMINEPIIIYPFAFRTHTHKLGKLVIGWRLNEDGWKLIGRHNPQEPQMFYPVNRTIPIKMGDIVAARCTMKNTKKTTVYIGSTGNDEMCNFYMMYYVEGDQILNQKNCFSPGPPYYYWNKNRMLYPIPKFIDIFSSKT